MRDSRARYRREVDQDRLVLPSRESEIGTDDHPSSVLVLSFERDAMRLKVLLADCDVDAAVGRIDPTIGDEPSLLADPQIYLDEMIFRDALILAAFKRREISSVPRRDEIGDVTTFVVPGLSDRPRMRQRVDGQRRRVAGESFVDEDVLICGMVDGQKRHVIDEVRLPQFG